MSKRSKNQSQSTADEPDSLPSSPKMETDHPENTENVDDETIDHLSKKQKMENSSFLEKTKSFVGDFTFSIGRMLGRGGDSSASKTTSQVDREKRYINRLTEILSEIITVAESSFIFMEPPKRLEYIRCITTCVLLEFFDKPTIMEISSKSSEKLYIETFTRKEKNCSEITWLLVIVCLLHYVLSGINAKTFDRQTHPDKVEKFLQSLTGFYSKETETSETYFKNFSRTLPTDDNIPIEDNNPIVFMLGGMKNLQDVIKKEETQKISSEKGFVKTSLSLMLFGSSLSKEDMNSEIRKKIRSFLDSTELRNAHVVNNYFPNLEVYDSFVKSYEHKILNPVVKYMTVSNSPSNLYSDIYALVKPDPESGSPEIIMPESHADRRLYLSRILVQYVDYLWNLHRIKETNKRIVFNITSLKSSQILTKLPSSTTRPQSGDYAELTWEFFENNNKFYNKFFLLDVPVMLHNVTTQCTLKRNNKDADEQLFSVFDYYEKVSFGRQSKLEDIPSINYCSFSNVLFFDPLNSQDDNTKSSQFGNSADIFLSHIPIASSGRCSDKILVNTIYSTKTTTDQAQIPKPIKESKIPKVEADVRGIFGIFEQFVRGTDESFVNISTTGLPQKKTNVYDYRPKSDPVLSKFPRHFLSKTRIVLPFVNHSQSVLTLHASNTRIPDKNDQFIRIDMTLDQIWKDPSYSKKTSKFFSNESLLKTASEEEEVLFVLLFKKTSFFRMFNVELETGHKDNYEKIKTNKEEEPVTVKFSLFKSSTERRSHASDPNIVDYSSGDTTQYGLYDFFSNIIVEQVDSKKVIQTRVDKLYSEFLEDEHFKCFLFLSKNCGTSPSDIDPKLLVCNVSNVFRFTAKIDDLPDENKSANDAHSKVHAMQTLASLLKNFNKIYHRLENANTSTKVRTIADRAVLFYGFVEILFDTYLLNNLVERKVSSKIQKSYRQFLVPELVKNITNLDSFSSSKFGTYSLDLDYFYHSGSYLTYSNDGFSDYHKLNYLLLLVADELLKDCSSSYGDNSSSSSGSSSSQKYGSAKCQSLYFVYANLFRTWLNVKCVNPADWTKVVLAQKRNLSIGRIEFLKASELEESIERRETTTAPQEGHSSIVTTKHLEKFTKLTKEQLAKHEILLQKERSIELNFTHDVYAQSALSFTSPSDFLATAQRGIDFTGLSVYREINDQLDNYMKLCKEHFGKSSKERISESSSVGQYKIKLHEDYVILKTMFTELITTRLRILNAARKLPPGTSHALNFTTSLYDITKT